MSQAAPSWPFIFYCVLSYIAFFACGQITVPQPGSQCPCFVIPGSNECVQYDSRFQAATLDEAMASFNDLTLDTMEANAQTEEQRADPDCQTEQCKECREHLKKKLKEVGLLPPETITSITANSTTICQKYSFTKEKKEKEEDKDDSSSSSDDDDDDDDDDEHKKEKKEWKDRAHEAKRDLKKQIKEWKKRAERHRRAASNPPADNPAVVGRRFNLSCNTKGIATDGSGMMTLCSRCWAWRELPANYYPRYMNELVCDDVDNSCLSGYAKCGVSHKAAYVVRNDTGVMNVVTLQAGSFCECRVQSGSVLASLVTGAQGAPLPVPVGQSAVAPADPNSPPKNTLWY